MRRLVMLVAVAFVAIGAFWLAGVGCADDDSTPAGCPSAAACSTGSCCAGRPGTWNTSLGRCICPDAVADSEVSADGDADADADVTPDETVTVEDVTVPDESTGCTGEMGGPCNAVLQCGCTTGERCVLNASNTEECAPTGTDPIGTPCGSADNCVAQNQCFGTSASDSQCMQFCYEDSDCPSSRTCDYGITGITGYRLCGEPPEACDPYTGTGCPSGEGCTITPPGGGTRCDPAGTTTVGGVCDTVNCTIGLGCYLVDTDGDTVADPPGHCYQFCDLTGTAHPCASGETCANLGHATIGVCVSG